ncbi:MAG: hypothetical protein KDA65_04435 [Planctomycetaceae bacterium]|nr:hypothetical protein [Planctomycetaceae bacterium]
MSKLLLKLVVSVGLISWLVGCSSMPGSSMVSSLSPSSLNPLSGIGSTFSGQSEPPVEEDLDFVNRGFNEKSAMVDSSDEEAVQLTDAELDFAE